MTTKEKNMIKKRNRKIIAIVIVIILFLLTLRSCAKEFDWTIGKIFGTSSEHEITDEADKEIIINKELKFDITKDNINLSDKEYKLSFSFSSINPSEFTCKTSDANIATCYVKDGYVVVIPKGPGKVIVYVEAVANGKIYQASTELNIADKEGSFNLSSNNGIIVLSKTNKKIITYNLKNINGDITVTTSDKNIATATAKDGVIVITAKKAGFVKFVFTIIDKDTNKNYTNVYNLTIVNDEVDFNNNQGNNNNNNSDYDDNKNNVGDTDNSNNNTTIPENSETIKDNNNNLEYIKINKGKLTPKFNKNTLNYNIYLDNKDSKITFDIKTESNKSTIRYIYNGKIIKNLNNLSVDVGDNLLLIEITAENGNSKTYTVVINRNNNNIVLTNDNYLKSLSIDNYQLTPNFDKDNSSYNVNVLYNTNTVNLNYELLNSQSRATVKINNTIIDDYNNIPLKEGSNILEIMVTDKDGNNRIYLVNIYRPTRTINLLNNRYSINIEQSPYYLNYQILEDGIEINDYDLNDIKVQFTNYSGNYELNKGYIKLTPNNSDMQKNIELSLEYNNKTDKASIYITSNEYYLNTPATKYDISFVNNFGSKNIILNNNILVGNITKTNITNGFRLTADNGAYIDVVLNDNLINVNYDNASSNNTSIVLSVEAKATGNSSITVSGNIFGNIINTYNIEFNIIEKFNIILDANGGFFDSFSDKYTYLLKSNETIDLSKFDALKVADIDNCLFYELESFNTDKFGNGTIYNRNDVISNFTSDMTLYAIYSSTSKYHTLQQNDRLYLTEVDLFHNEEYYEKYNVDKIIYPGSEGAHVMSITNNSISKLKIKAINLEEDTICLSERKCINIGYIIKSALDVNKPYTYFYGNNNNYSILNKDANTIYSSGTITDYHTTNNINIDPNIEIDVGETKEISILWKWVDIDDNLDTQIGSNYQTLGDTYSLTVSIDFERESNTCVLP